MTAITDPYEALGVSRAASPAEIRRAYHKLVVENHPDTHPDDPAAEARLKYVNAAYQILAPRPAQEFEKAPAQSRPPADPQDLKIAFTAYAGRTVEVIEEEQGVRFADKEPLLREIKDKAAQNGLTVRFMLPGTWATMDFRTDRLNVNVTKGPDGRYRIDSGMTLG